MWSGGKNPSGIKGKRFRFHVSLAEQQHRARLNHAVYWEPTITSTPHTHNTPIPSEFMNILPYRALQIIFIKNCLITGDAIWAWGDEGKKEAGLPVQNENDWLLLEAHDEPETGLVYREAFNVSVDHILIEWVLMLSGSVTESIVFLSLLKNVWWASKLTARGLISVSSNHLFIYPPDFHLTCSCFPYWVLPMYCLTFQGRSNSQWLVDLENVWELTVVVNTQKW